MAKFYLLLAISISAFYFSASADEGMKIQFSFGPTKPCTTVFPNPEIRLKHVPAETRTVIVRFRREKDYEMGGQEIPLPSDHLIKSESLRTWGPCNSGLYTYEVIAKASTGAVLAKAEWSEPYPP
uniref:Uncharacterized protein n=1 Tax=Bradyrhizobium amphicarpaeae TaxID=1404768 RepID=A0A2U8PW61_9BRAD|nr:hypothetical protein CIT40_19900 [Bradyrhizobium amphicarpaeae]